MMLRSAAALLLGLGTIVVLADASSETENSPPPPQQQQEKQPQQSEATWHRFGTNANYRLVAVLDVNGGADAGPDFESFTDSGAKVDGTVDSSSSSISSCIKRILFQGGDHHSEDDEASILERLKNCLGDDASDEDSDGSSNQDDSSTTNSKSRGYSIPLEVLTLVDATTGEYRQRISYYSGGTTATQVDYNTNGAGYKVVPTPYLGKRATAEREHDATDRVCFATGGGEDDDDDASKKKGYLNFFPTLEQMEHYTLGKLITSEPGVPYRVASLEAPHGSYDPTSQTEQPDASYDAHPGMPSNDWFQFHYEESITGVSGKKAGRPIQWTMLARNQIINAHTENWVLRYLSYESIDGEEEQKLWENWYDAKFAGDCSESDNEPHTWLGKDGHGRYKMKTNRLGMFFSTTSANTESLKSNFESKVDGSFDEFDQFLVRHNKQYHGHEYFERKSKHQINTDRLRKWNEEHAGMTTFAPNEFMDMSAKEVMQFRGGHVPPRGKRRTGDLTQGKREESNDNLSIYLRRVVNSAKGQEDGDNVLLGDGSEDEEDEFTPYETPSGFDPSTLPESFDWRDHLPGSVGAIKDQGFCGSCWAFSFVSALESHWFIANGQSVVLPEQFVNDCAWSDAAHACDGGDSGGAAKNLIDKFGGKVPTRDAYGGYLSVDGGCYLDVLEDLGMMDVGENGKLAASEPSSMVQLTDWVALPERDDIATKHALYTKGPLSVALNVVDEATYYSSGVLDVESCKAHGVESLDHAVNLVGWGVDVLPDGSKAEHWILRNSWSSLWGDSGYFRVRMGDKDCGITTSPGFPVVKATGGIESVSPVATS
eukprot:CAMPEP_0183715224 /NCGR_PEP_ID=MMETSP0737-20130205/9545_1 /TAXON_ID=385413 /ORGANISM="Thalassiosira miniscula, Strain CCMP1093" /LENGTH=824 /DNA_ID=CAMNT_0025944313 /DNA_START=105 /DNA_END=2579 /DNA_ORIENTATION=+